MCLKPIRGEWLPSSFILEHTGYIGTDSQLPCRCQVTPFKIDWASDPSQTNQTWFQGKRVSPYLRQLWDMRPGSLEKPCSQPWGFMVYYASRSQHAERSRNSIPNFLLSQDPAFPVLLALH